jgi:hypothetical protein
MIPTSSSPQKRRRNNNAGGYQNDGQVQKKIILIPAGLFSGDPYAYCVHTTKERLLNL